MLHTNAGTSHTPNKYQAKAECTIVIFLTILVSILIIAVFLAMSINKKDATRDVDTHLCASSAINILQRLLIALFVNFRCSTPMVFAKWMRRYHYHHQCHHQLSASNAVVFNFPMEYMLLFLSFFFPSLRLYVWYSSVKYGIKNHSNND